MRWLINSVLLLSVFLLSFSPALATVASLQTIESSSPPTTTATTTTSSTATTARGISPEQLLARYTADQIAQCRGLLNLLSSIVDTATGAFTQTLAQAVSDAGIALLAASTSPDCSQIDFIIQHLSGNVSSSSSSERRQKVPRGPHLHDDELASPPFAGCDGGPFATYVTLIATNLGIGPVSIPPVLDSEPICANTGDWDREASLHIATQAMTAIQYALDAACSASESFCISTFPGVPCIPVAPIPCGLKQLGEYVVGAIALWNDMVNTQDGMVADALTAASYYNMVSIYNATRCLNATAPRKHHGCNGMDENCNLIVDECEEDTFAPDITLDVDLLASAPVFSSFAAASAFAANVVKSAIDDCTPSVTITSPALSGTCNAVTARINATDQCGNMASTAFNLSVDTTPPTVTCDVGIPQLTYYLRSHEFNLYNVNFTFTATDDCGVPTVTLTVYTDQMPVGPMPDAIIMQDFYGKYQGLQLRVVSLVRRPSLPFFIFRTISHSFSSLLLPSSSSSFFFSSSSLSFSFFSFLFFLLFYYF